MQKNLLKMAMLRNIKPDGTTIRFWKNVSVAPMSSFEIPPDVKVAPKRPGSGEQYLVLLDERGMRTPFDHVFAVPSEPLAYMLATEWDMQGDFVRSESMPLMRLATTAIDIVSTRRQQTIDGLLVYLKHDSLTFWADETKEPDLFESQSEIYTHAIEWFNETFGVTLKLNTGLLPIDQSPETNEAVSAALHAMDDWRLAAIDQMSGACKSLVVAIMFEAGKLNYTQAMGAARSEELYNINRWGSIEAGHDLDESLSDLILASANTFARTLQ